MGHKKESENRIGSDYAQQLISWPHARPHAQAHGDNLLGRHLQAIVSHEFALRLNKAPY